MLFLPGQNDYSSLSLNPQIPKVKAASIDLSTAEAYPVHIGVSAPALTAREVSVVDAQSGTVLYQKNPDFQLLPASTTKIMTALVALEQYELDEIVSVQQASDSIGHSMGLVKGEKISVKNLLYGILVESGNDAAFALAQHYPGGYSAFVDRMNEKARELNLENTSFRNVSGVEQYGHLTSVRDLSTIARFALQNNTFATMVNTKQITVASTDSAYTHTLQNINQLLGVVQGIKGVKTGWTENAGECLVAAVERNGREIITVILGSDDRFGETTQLLDWAYANHQWEDLET